MAFQPQPPAIRASYPIPLFPSSIQAAWLVSSPLDLISAHYCLDQRLPDTFPPGFPDDPNTYMLGKVGKVFVVVVCLPQRPEDLVERGVRHLLRTFTGLRFAIISGTAAAIPAEPVQLGDVVIGTKIIPFSSDHSAVVNEFLPPPGYLLAALGQVLSPNGIRRRFVGDVFWQPRPKEHLSNCGVPGHEGLDVAFVPEPTSHRDMELPGLPPCRGCDKSGALVRNYGNEPNFHHGVVATSVGDLPAVFTPAELDPLVEEKVLCMDICLSRTLYRELPCLVVRGISHYADGHRAGVEHVWRAYAGAVACVVVRAVLGRVKVDVMEKCEREMQERKASVVSVGHSTASPRSDTGEGVFEDDSRRESVGTENTEVSSPETLTPMKIPERLSERVSYTVSIQDGKLTLVPVSITTYPAESPDWISLAPYLKHPWDLPQHRAFSQHRHPKTGIWFLSSPQVKQWLELASGRALLVPGAPGTGKSVLTSLVVDTLRAELTKTETQQTKGASLVDDRPVVACLYDVYQLPGQETDEWFTKLCASLLGQIVCSVLDKRQLQDVKPSNIWLNKEQSFRTLVRCLVSPKALSARPVYILLDGLEQPDSNPNTESPIFASGELAAGWGPYTRDFMSILFTLQRTRGVNVFITTKTPSSMLFKQIIQPLGRMRASGWSNSPLQIAGVEVLYPNQKFDFEEIRKMLEDKVVLFTQNKRVGLTHQKLMNEVCDGKSMFLNGDIIKGLDEEVIKKCMATGATIMTGEAFGISPDTMFVVDIGGERSKEDVMTWLEEIFPRIPGWDLVDGGTSRRIKRDLMVICDGVFLIAYLVIQELFSAASSVPRDQVGKFLGKLTARLKKTVLPNRKKCLNSRFDGQVLSLASMYKHIYSRLACSNAVHDVECCEANAKARKGHLTEKILFLRSAIRVLREREEGWMDGRVRLSGIMNALRTSFPACSHVKPGSSSVEQNRKTVVEEEGMDVAKALECADATLFEFVGDGEGDLWDPELRVVHWSLGEFLEAWLEEKGNARVGA